MLKPFFKSATIEAGCDEAGRGCLAGPVFAAAVILPKKFENNLLNDSKQLSKKNRDKLRCIIEQEAIDFAVAQIGPAEIDKINILNASIAAMHKAISMLKVVPQHLIIDGNRFKPYSNIPHHCIVKGDSLYLSIAAASVLAKTYRDEYMENLAKDFPHYTWHQNKGYPTAAHRKAIADYGITEHHRKSYKLTSNQLELNFAP
ncbi:MAG TPA: ribonuclease HII [Bacteroidetes bacterium]|mgnify:CR=1 FL=1|nr:ribonuclease HII [Bacteroidota bacterium]